MAAEVLVMDVEEEAGRNKDPGVLIFARVSGLLLCGNSVSDHLFWFVAICIHCVCLLAMTRPMKVPVKGNESSVELQYCDCGL